MAYGERDDETSELKAPALVKGGVVARGITRVLNLKDRTKGLGDVEICLDGDWWDDATTEQRLALLDHQLHHIVVTEKNDDIGRPIIKLRKHDYEFGWFKVIAERHGTASQECETARRIMDKDGQYFWPALAALANNVVDKSEAVARAVRNSSTVTIEGAGKSVTMSTEKFAKLAKQMPR